MTREEARHYLSVPSSTNGSGRCTDEQHYEAKQIAIKALEQEPCEDAVSRQAVLDYLNETISAEKKHAYHSIDDAPKTRIDMCERVKIKVDALPSVRPQEQTGKWQEHENGQWIYSKCSECKTIHDTRSNYCPFCGARMDGYFAGLTKLRGE